MKKFKMFALMFASLALGACSNDNIVESDVQGGNVPAGEPGYISLSLNLPTEPSSRAANDNFDDGIAAEYKVNNAALLLFGAKNSKEDEATFLGGYKISLPANGETGGGNITSIYRVAEQITKPVDGIKYVYAMVLANYYDNILSGTDGTLEWRLFGEALNGKTVAQVKEIKANMDVNQIADVARSNFLMTNAPLYYGTPGGTTEPKGETCTMTEINVDHIYSTEAEAMDNPAANVYIERAVAKVTVTVAPNPEPSRAVPGSTFYHDAKGWVLDITNKQSYVVRNVTGANWWQLAADQIEMGGDKYRFVGSNPVGSINGYPVNIYRTYWAYDPNYNGIGYITGEEINEGTFNMFSETAIEESQLIPMTQAGYCLENTFDINNQNENQTTRVVLAAALRNHEAQEPSDFFTINDNKEKLYEKVGVDAVIANAYMADPTIKAALDENLKPKEEIPNGFGVSDLVVKYKDNLEKGGYIEVEEISVKEGAEVKFKNNRIPAELEAGNNNEVVASVNEHNKIGYYKGGISYYPIKIKHFGDDSTPWSIDAPQYVEKNHLGRYGVLRNNWYEINVTGIKKIGYPGVPPVYGNPDDPDESWLSVEINVLSWAKRSQDVEL